MSERESSTEEQLTQEEEHGLLEMYKEFLAYLQYKYGEDILDPIDAVKFKEKLRKVYLENKYHSAGEWNSFAVYKWEAMFQFLAESYGIGYIDLKLKENSGMKDEVMKMLPIWRKQKEEESLSGE